MQIRASSIRPPTFLMLPLVLVVALGLVLVLRHGGGGVAGTVHRRPSTAVPGPPGGSGVCPARPRGYAGRRRDADLDRQLAERVEGQRLRPVAQSARSGSGVGLDDQPVGAGREGGLGERRAPSGGGRRRGSGPRSPADGSAPGRRTTAERSRVLRVAVSNVRMPRSHRTTRSLPPASTYSAAASHSAIARRHPALEQDRRPRPADLLEQLEVLHVARADLEHVGLARDGLDVSGVEHLGHDGQAVLAPCLVHHRESLETEPLEVVRQRARLEAAAAQHRPAGLADGLGRREDLLPALDRARAGDEHRRVVAADA